MKNYFKYLKSLLVSHEAGQALIIVLVFILLGMLTLVPTLAHMSTALKTNVVYENKSNEFFTADAGIENGLWRIKYDDLGPTYSPYDFDTVFSYQTDPVNNRNAAVTVQNVWLPTNVTLDSLGITPEQAQTMVDAEKLVVSGTSGAIPHQPYHIAIAFTPATGDNLTIKSVGIWLPQGFTYANNCTLETGGPLTKYHPNAETVTTVPGGTSIVWSYVAPYPCFIDFPNFDSENGTLSSTITFSYNPPASNPSKLPLAVAWVTTNQVTSSPIAWDTDTRYYQITGASGKTQIETYSSKSELRKLGDAISGSYVAVGNSLMIGNVTKRDQLLSSSSCNVSTVNPIPADADVLQAILYWTGFRLATSIFSDACSDFSNWTRSYQTQVPTADNVSSGTWTCTPASPANFWDKVNETSPDDNDYITGNVSGSGPFYKLFNFSAFSVPTGATISDVTVYFRAKDYSSGTNKIGAIIKAGSSNTTGTLVEPGSSWTTYSSVFTTNPSGGAAWTVTDVNGGGSNGLKNFGIYSNDLSPAVSVSMVYAQVNYSLWTISSGQFRGQGSSGSDTGMRTLTLTNSIDLHSYAPGTVALYWDQTTGGTLESSDILYYAMSGDGGSTWSSDIQAFSGGSPDSPFWALVPSANMTSTFKFRFYFTFENSAEYVYLDDIRLLSVPPDTDVNFLINNQQVYLDGSGQPQAGSQKLTASSSAVLVNTSSAAIDSGKYGYFYACHRDVSKLVKKYPVVAGETHHTGNAQYTVGDVTADTGQYISFAGWSLIIIYTSPATAGHYLYLNDIFAYNPGNSNLDFDHDGTPGGVVTGFVIPEPIRNKSGTILETVAANVTCFVGEGDAIYTGDSVQITGQQSGNSKYLSNSASPQDNVWNGADTVSSYPGIDIDTFTVYWNDNILMPGDTRLHLDLTTQTDVWELIYIIMSVRSETVTGGTENFIIHNTS